MSSNFVKAILVEIIKKNKKNASIIGARNAAVRDIKRIALQFRNKYYELNKQLKKMKE